MALGGEHFPANPARTSPAAIPPPWRDCKVTTLPVKRERPSRVVAKIRKKDDKLQG